MKHRFGLLAILVAAALTANACGGATDDGSSDRGSSSGNSEESMSETSGMQNMDMGSMLVDENGEYSDELFINEMVPHHRAAIAEAEVALQNTDRPELVELSENIIASQEREIEELARIKEEKFGSSDVPEGMSDEEMEMMGMSMTPEELAEARPFDRAFIDNMIPHHESAISMAEVALENSENQDIRRIAGDIISAQEAEIEQMQTWRDEWYPNS